ncbi:hypothetical protein [Pseudovibrio denitrificans]|uniref:hypothetical protein n=1 Tax=Pseudovibrio denitrificans TaxID=258256 RepID=UPI001FCB2AD1|nr:hypothetical protein [Pseudovibrio denitrificans]
MRLNTARQYIENPQTSINEVVRRCGFENGEKMRRSFIRNLGISLRITATDSVAANSKTPTTKALMKPGASPGMDHCALITKQTERNPHEKAKNRSLPLSRHDHAGCLRAPSIPGVCKRFRDLYVC